MNHPDKYKTKRYDTLGRCAEFTDIVYGEAYDDADSSAQPCTVRPVNSIRPPPICRCSWARCTDTPIYPTVSPISIPISAISAT